ncbi:MAG: hypothetical protein INR68_16685 [Methylobacterium mesophilicum]|nr:hypothetical protein [Methylobacterium mesophilicum]
MTALALIIFGGALCFAGFAIATTIKRNRGKIADALAGRPIRKDVR